MTFLKEEEVEEEKKGDADGSSVTDSSLMFEKTKMLEFNSALDIFSEIDSQYFDKQSPRRRGTINKHVATVMKPIVAEDSEYERGSDFGTERDRESQGKNNDDEDINDDDEGDEGG